ncbi:odorant receptor 49b-like isoform X1 [Osmia bicornis bicornis]|uniref:odorant receptor 49b-like isoform X1 n=1 Tax=Osmia bicornis bicornis TaxID=1437191 RepID=UPI001EAF620E|nr:odorant receptor 49b-like isoform X1 [Osmia bicornis bicornis]
MDQLQLYYKHTIFLLSATGLWPYQNKYIRSVYNIFIMVVFLFCLGAQITALTNTEHTLHDWLRNILFISAIAGFLVKYGTYYIHADKIKQLMEEVKRDWRIHNDEPLEILRNFANSGKRYSFYFALIGFTLIFVVMGFETCNSILDAVAPLNYTRPYVIHAVYFIDERKYRFLILIHQYFTFLIYTCVFVGIDSLIILWLHHFAALYVLVSYYIYQGVMEHITHNSNRHLGNSKRLLITAVVIHSRVMKYLDIFGNIVSVSYMLLVLLTIITQSINIFILAQTIFKLEANGDAMLCLSCTFCEIIYFFYLTYIWQQCLSTFDNLTLQIYNTNWYEASLSTQKFLLFVMMKTSEDLRLKLFIVFKPSLEGFMQILKVCFSYFTVMATIEERHQ